MDDPMDMLSHLLRDYPVLALLLFLGWSVREIVGWVGTRNGSEGGRTRERVAQLEARMVALAELLQRQQQELDERPPKWLTDQVREVRADVQHLSARVNQLRCHGGE